MRKMLFLFLLFPLLTTAQQDEYDIAFNKSIPRDLGKPIHLPERSYNPNFRWDDTVGYEIKPRIFVVRADSVYRKLFWRYIYTEDSVKKCRKDKGDPWWCNWMAQHYIDSLPIIDFSKNELVMYSACAQCLTLCPGHEPCHRNACDFRETWFIREKKNGSARGN